MITSFMPITWTQKRNLLFQSYWKARTAHAKVLKKALKSGKFGAEVLAKRKMEKAISALKVQLAKKRRK